MNLASNNNQFEEYLNKYINVVVNGSNKKFFVQKSNKFSSSTGLGLLDDSSAFSYSIIGESSLQQCSDFAGLSWVFSYGGTLDGNPWTFTSPATSVRFDIEDSFNCGGANSAVQYGTALASISTGFTDIYMNLDFTGLAEDHDEYFENMSFFLNGVKVASATSHGYNLSCSSFSPPQTGYIVNPPYLLSANSVNEFLIDFTTKDERYHVDCFYQINLQFFRNEAMTIPAILS
jgi:hypothetical protein